VIDVTMGDGLIAMAPNLLLCKGLGSCVAVILYDGVLRLGGLAHVMLPAGLAQARRPYCYADSAVTTLLQALTCHNVSRQRLTARLVGGARMFAAVPAEGPGIGEQNIRVLRQILRDEGIPLVGEDVGGQHGRNVAFEPVTGRVVVTAIGKPERVI
jgi:chemotaxis protein CheD